jgi:thiamine biosynthesis lipoprotein
MSRASGLLPASTSFHALGTTATVVTADPRALDEAQFIVARELREIDAACSRFRLDSELSRVNGAAGRWVPIGAILRDALDAALTAAASTSGLIDPTVGNSLLALGYRRDFWSGAPSPDPAFSVAPAGRWREIELDTIAGRVRAPRGVALDLGATAKALASDRAARTAARVGGGVLVSLGGDVSVAGPAPETGWIVRVSDDHRAPAGTPGQTVVITDGGLATSSTALRAWTRGGIPVHHIVDPRTGVPADPVWRTVSVAGGTCLEANVAATASIVLGEGAIGWLGGRSLPARLVRRSGNVVTVAGWPDDVEQAGAP